MNPATEQFGGEHVAACGHQVSILFLYLALVDCPDSQLTLDSRDQRRPLEDSSLKFLQGLGKLGLAWNGAVQAAYGNVLQDATTASASSQKSGKSRMSGCRNAPKRSTLDRAVVCAPASGIVLTSHSTCFRRRGQDGANKAATK